MLTIDDLRADASMILGNLDACWSPGAAVRHVTDTLVRIHPGITRDEATVACEQAMWSGWPR